MMRMNENTEHKQKVMTSFDMASEGYDCSGLRFFVESAACLVRKLRLTGDEELLDIATGTGHVAIAAARELRRGFVTGIDISEKMLQKARDKADGMDLRNLTFKRFDIESMGFEDAAFDTVTCAFGLFFLEDMEKGLKAVSRVLKPGGKLGLTSFAPTLMMPLRGMLLARLKRYGIEQTHLAWMRLDAPDKINGLLCAGGYGDIDIQPGQMGYYLKNGKEYWDALWNSGHRALLSQLSRDDLKRFKNEHLAEVDRTADENGIWLEVEVLFATATLGKK